jgi:hypothetical protein
MNEVRCISAAPAAVASVFLVALFIGPGNAPFAAGGAPLTTPVPGVAVTGPEAALVDATTRLPADLQDDFANMMSGWNVIDRGNYRVGYDNGTYAIALDASFDGWVLGTNGKLVADGIVQIDARVDTASAVPSFGIFVRGQDPQNFHGFLVGTNEFFAPFHVRRGQLDILDVDPPDNLPKDLLVTDGPNRFQVFMDGSNIVYFLNGREMARVAAFWPTGFSGVLSASVKQKAKVAFDDWKVWTSGSNAARAGPAQR